MTKQVSRDTGERLKQLILARLLSTGKAPDVSAVDATLKRYFVDRLSLCSSQWRDLLRRALNELTECGMVESMPLQLTEQGQHAAESFVFGSDTPVRVTWRTLRNRHLVAKALGISPRSKSEWERLKTADGLRAAVLTRKFRLPIGSVPTLAKTLDALAWHQLKESRDAEALYATKFNRKAVLRATLLGGRSVRDDGAALAAIASGATNSAVDRVREAVICDWIHEPPSRTVTSDDVDLEAFARRVSELACASSSGRYGEHKVFISHVWNRFRQEGIAQGMTRDDFNRYLVDANRQALLTLSRADLVSAMTPEDVQQSEVQLSTSSFHFIRTDSQTI